VEGLNPVKRAYRKHPNNTSENSIRRIIAQARNTARRHLNGREREIKIEPAYSGHGWDCWEYTDSGGQILAENVSWHEAMRAGAAFLRDCLQPCGLTPCIEIRIGHGSNADQNAELS
jgi:hypothetical protein